MLRRGVPAASVTAVACAAIGLVPAVGNAAPAPGTATAGFSADPRLAAEQHIADLYQQAEALTQQYDADQESIGRLQAAVAAESGQSAAAQSLLARLSGGLGRLAAEQYRDVGDTSSLTLLFATHPDLYLQRAVLNDRVAALDAQQVQSARVLQAQLTSLRALGQTELANLQQAHAALVEQRATIEAELAQARAQLDSLGFADRHVVAEALAEGEGGDGFGTAQSVHPPSLGALLAAVNTAVAGSGGQADIDAGRAQRAISAAYAELGKPYVWGAVGPYGFDCSGLMQHVWAKAGVMLPRTSQEQASIGPPVPLSGIRPGDLVIYFAGRTHVGMYVGHGLVIHAPRPGSEVQFAALRAMPISKIVRPDGN
ncbi:C40 family peptidase [Actinospica durhamensis]|uniref:C40 family peptidase n=1 Tax=Actinospica durhamensis TaxID=1508375 RepID=A0A941INL7_9ACTN|nr:C40 family peptidase [Actinospica durhamensis]